MEKKLVQSRIRADVYDTLQHIAKQRRQHVAGLVRLILTDYVVKHIEKERDNGQRD